MDRKFIGNPNLVKSTYYKPEYINKIVKEIKNPLKPVMLKLLDPAIDATSKVKALHELAQIIKKVRELPKPTKENTKRYTSHQLIEIRDYIFSRIKNIPFLKEMEEAADVLIIITDTDFYEPFIRVLLLQIAMRDWPPLRQTEPDHHFWDSKN